MPGKPDDEAVKLFQLELEIFGKKNAPQYRLIEDLSLCIHTCKTPQVGLSLREDMKKIVAEMAVKENTFNSRMNKMLIAEAKKIEKDKNAKETDFKKSESAIQKLVDKFTSKYLGGVKGVYLKGKVKGVVDSKGNKKVKEASIGLGGKLPI